MAIFGGVVTVDRSDIHDNQAYYGDFFPGAGIYVSGLAQVAVMNTRIYYNTASTGGGVAIDSGNVSFVGCDIFDNQATRAGGVYTRGNTTTDDATAIYDNIPNDCAGDPSWSEPACGRQPPHV